MGGRCGPLCGGGIFVEEVAPPRINYVQREIEPSYADAFLKILELK